jgi:hypothetical protein
MPIINIKENENKEIKNMTPIKEIMDIHLPDIPEGVSRRNGMIYLLIGSGGSGKSSLLYNFFRKGGAYYKKFHNLYLFTPPTSFLSIENHPFKKHDKVYHELTTDGLQDLKDILTTSKLEQDEDDAEYNCVVIDDFANDLKSKDIQKELNSMLIKARHLNTSFIFTVQSYLYFPKILRKQITYATIFRPKNQEEWKTIRNEILQMNEDDAKIIFDYAFDKPYQHLDIDTFENKIYKNFNLLDITTNNKI